jgi:hypothetical protein
MARNMTIEELRYRLRDPELDARMATRALGSTGGVWSAQCRVRTVAEWLDACQSVKPEVREFVVRIAGL